LPISPKSSPLRSDDAARSSGESHLFAANVYPQDELRGANQVELSPVNKVIPSDPPRAESEGSALVLRSQLGSSEVAVISVPQETKADSSSSRRVNAKSTVWRDSSE